MEQRLVPVNTRDHWCFFLLGVTSSLLGAQFVILTFKIPGGIVNQKAETARFELFEFTHFNSFKMNKLQQIKNLHFFLVSENTINSDSVQDMNSAIGEQDIN